MTNTLRGSYVYENLAELRFVRSGKAVSIVERVFEHASAAGNTVLTDSRFYLSYPTKGAVQRNAQLGDSRVRKGWFENLRPVIALAYLKDRGPRVVAMFTYGPTACASNSRPGGPRTSSSRRRWSSSTTCSRSCTSSR